MIDIKKIRQLRKEKKISVNKMAEILGVSRFTVTSWEHKRTTPTKTDLIVIAQILGVSLRDISDYDDPATRELFGELSTSSAENISRTPIDSIIEEFKDLQSASGEESLNKFKKILVDYKSLLKKNQTLNKNNLRLLVILSSINEIVYIKETNRVIRKVNDKFLDLLHNEYTEEDTIGLKFIDIFGRKEIEDIVALENKVFESGISITDEKIRIPGSGGNRLGLATLKPIVDDKGEVFEIAVSIKDITELLDNIEKLELLKDISSKLEENIWIMSERPLKYKFLGGSNIKEMYGVDRDLILKDPKVWFNFIDEQDRKSSGFDKEKNLMPLGEHTLKVLSEDGNVGKWLKYKAYRTNDAKNKSVLYGITADITEEKNKTESLEFLDRAIRNSGDFIFVSEVKKNKFKFKYISDNSDKLFDINKKEFNGSFETFSKKIISIDRDKFNNWLNSKKNYREVEFRFLINDELKYFHGKMARSENDIQYGSITDISIQKKEKYERFMLVQAMNSTKEAVWIYDMNNDIMATKSVHRLYGIPENEKNPTRFWHENVLHPDSKADFVKNYKIYKSEKKKNPKYIPKPFKYKAMRTDGKILNIETVFSCMEYENKVFDIAVDRDISDRKN